VASADVRILVVSQMWPGPADPDLGAFVAQVARELEALGHEVDHAILDTRAGGPARHARLLGRTLRARRPDVAFAHFLVPTGLTALLAARAPVVVMAHGNDVANAERSAPLRAATRLVVRRAAGVIANSEHLAGRLEALTGVRAEVIDCGVDMETFAPGVEPATWEGDHPRFLCVGSLVERKNVVALADAFAAYGHGSLAFVGDGPLRGALEGRPGVHIAGRVPHAEVPRWIAACDVLCQPSLLEPFGQAALEAMAMERSVVATREGGPPEFVTPEAGVLVDPHDAASIADGLRRAAELPSPNPAARRAAAPHDARRQAERMASVLADAARS
jgi:glycosyltransferase involved in cell wall biosynthesis